MSALTVHQQQAIDDYFDLLQKYPELFSPRLLHPIVYDRHRLEEYASSHNVVLGVAAQTPLALFVVDLVEAESSTGDILEYPYFRVVNQKQLKGAMGVVVLGTIANADLGTIGDIVLIEQERHSTGFFHFELPRGFGELDLTAEQNALKELKEETGYIGEKAQFLGWTYTDTGIGDTRVFFYQVPIIEKADATPEISEAIRGVKLISLSELQERIHSGEITDGYTVQALSLFRKIQASED